MVIIFTYIKIEYSEYLKKWIAEIMPKRLFLIDGMALAYRTYFAFARNPLTNSKGENVSAVFGFTNILLKILDTESPDYLAVVFDTREPTFRHELYPEYKAQRADMPQDMIDQLPRIHQMLKILNIPTVSKPGYEADDIIGTFAHKAKDLDIQSILVTGDKDFMQLVNESVIMYNPKRSGEEPEWLDRDNVIKKIGLAPEQIIDYLALMGDSSDNIPGVPGIGPKTALTLLTEYKNLDNVLANIENIKNKRARTSLQDNEKMAILAKQLVTIDCNVPVEQKPDELVVGEPNYTDAFEFFQEMEFRTLTNRFAPEKETVEAKYNLVQTKEQFESFIKELKEQTEFAFDTETTSLDPLLAKLVGFSFSWQEGVAYYLPLLTPQTTVDDIKPLDEALVLNSLRDIFADPDVKKCAHNAKYDILVLIKYGIQIKGLACDTMVASYLVNPSGRQHNLDALSLSYFNITKVPTTELIGSGKKQITMDQVPVDKITYYACEDADMTWRLKNLFMQKLPTLNLLDLFNNVEMPLVDVLVEMEKNGVSLDEMYLANMSIELDHSLKQLEQKIYALADQKFNINSPKQLGTILFEKLKLPVIRKTKTGYSTDVSVLEELAKEHELPKQILEYRQLAKLKSTYVDALPQLISKATGRVHTSYNQTVAATGRLSSSDPNLQNIPIRTEIGRRIRKAFIPAKKGHILLDADYSQIELRIMAHLSKDKNLNDAFLKDQDIHTQTASLVFEVDPKDITSDQRRKAKEVNFGIMYGMGAYGLAQRLDISPSEADEFIQAYFANYPGVQNFMNEIVKQARAKGFVTTLLNRRRYLPEINSDNRRVRDFAERTAINTPIQGSAADLIKIAMINIQNRIVSEKLESKMIMQVHDELVFEIPLTEKEQMEKLVVHEMENAIQLDVPIKVDIGNGENWLDAH